MKYTIKEIKAWILFQISNPQSDRTKVQSWYKYYQSTGGTQWDLTYGDAPCFCRLAKKAGQLIIEEYGGNDLIKLMFPGVWIHSHRNAVKWEKV